MLRSLILAAALVLVWAPGTAGAVSLFLEDHNTGFTDGALAPPQEIPGGGLPTAPVADGATVNVYDLYLDLTGLTGPLKATSLKIDLAAGVSVTTFNTSSTMGNQITTPLAATGSWASTGNNVSGWSCDAAYGIYGAMQGIGCNPGTNYNEANIDAGGPRLVGWLGIVVAPGTTGTLVSVNSASNVNVDDTIHNVALDVLLPVPAPGAMVLLGMGLVGLAFARRRS